MSLVNVTNITVLDNPTCFLNPFQFEIQIESLVDLQEEHDLEWKVIYVVDPEDSSQDVVLEEVLVGPIKCGHHKFVLQADPPQQRQQQGDDDDGVPIELGVTVVLITCSYRDQEFVRIGYYLHNGLLVPATADHNAQVDEWMGMKRNAETGEWVVPEGQPLPLQHVTRTILADKPRVTRFPIVWIPDKQQQQEETENVLEEDGDAMEENESEMDDDEMVEDESNDESDEDFVDASSPSLFQTAVLTSPALTTTASPAMINKRFGASAGGSSAAPVVTPSAPTMQ